MSTTQKEQQPKLILHWLEESRAQRIVWLLEELELEYTLKLYHRSQGKAADAALLEKSQLGKSPVLEIESIDSETGQVTTKFVEESGFIISYIIDHFDYSHKLSSLSSEEKELVQFYLHFTEGTFQPFLTFVVVHAVANGMSPFFARFITSKFTQTIDTLYSLKNINLTCEKLEKDLEKNYSQNTSSSQDLFFVSNKITGADIILIFPLEVIFESNRLQDLGFDVSKYPLLAKWVSEIRSRAAYRRSYERVEREGKGQFKIGPPLHNNGA
ncbi:hypothetical protein WICPIJ_003187 [Wickerhamomyces pijperi]|uniref:Glutathione transferase n=1 Tax=Wickerhamomyces pijperi TaxID=599730 RepID=A0A9P8Q834_WICPI|nr:hypothetical protein WICPIJ_003187 [Wickerhamomyces pijperi]